MKIDSLQRQMEYLEMLQQRHMHWAKETDNIDAKSKHLDIVATLRKVTDEYEFLLDFYGQENTLDDSDYSP